MKEIIYKVRRIVPLNDKVYGLYSNKALAEKVLKKAVKQDGNTEDVAYYYEENDMLHAKVGQGNFSAFYIVVEMEVHNEVNI